MFILDTDAEIRMVGQRNEQLRKEVADLRLARGQRSSAGGTSRPWRRRLVVPRPGRQVVARLFGRSCSHRWSEPTITQRSLASSSFGEWFCLDCGTRRRSMVI